MNKYQIILLWFGISFIILMGIFPPWTFDVTVEGLSLHSLPQYRFILYPPFPPLPGVPNNDVFSYHIDIIQLSVQWFLVICITTGLVITFKNKNN